MNNLKIKSTALIIIIVIANLLTFSLNLIPINKKSITKQEISANNTNKDVLIIDDFYKYAYFGWHAPTAFSTTIWELLNNTVLWASSFSPPDTTKIILFREPANSYAVEVYNWLIGGGYKSENIILHVTNDTEILPSSYYNDFDLILYWDIYGYDITNIVNSTIPFITVSATQTDEMGIGTGTLSMSGVNDTFYVVNNDYYPTYSYSLCSLIFDDSYSFESTEASGDGKVLVKAEVESITEQIEMSMIQNITILPGSEGNANMTFTITIPDSPLADIFREAFFTNASLLEKDVEYEVPDNITLSSKVNLEKGIEDVSLKGDVINNDGQVDKEDIELIANYLGYTLGDDSWNSNLDLNWDGKIDMKDIAIAAHNYGKTVNNTGSLFVIGYYNGTSVNCTNVYYRGPEGSQKINISDGGYIWYNILPGNYTVFGTYNGIERSVNIVIEPEKVSYVQLDFGGLPPPMLQQEYIPTKETFYQGLTMEQMLLLGFDVSFSQSKILPWSTDNITKISLVADSYHLANTSDFQNWLIYIGPQNENATILTADFIFTKIEYMMLLLQSLAGDQKYIFNWQMSINLPAGSNLTNGPDLNGLNWTIDFGGGTFMQTNVTVQAEKVILNEQMVVTEQNITADDTYLETVFSQYKVFSINYSYLPPPSLLSSLSSQIGLAISASEDGAGWSKTWSFTIAPKIPQKRWSFGPLALTLKAIPTLNIQWYLGWEKTWKFGKLEYFETWMKITPSIMVEASLSATLQYSKTWSYTFLTLSTRFSFWAGCVPIWANLKLQVTASITVAAYGQISITTSAKLFTWYKAGVKWTRTSGWSTIWERGSGASRTGPIISGSAGLSVTPSVGCRLSFLLYDVGGPFVEAVPYAPIVINYYTYQPNTWSISLKLKINVGITLAGWLNKILKLSSYSKTVADITLMSWGGTW